MLQEEQYDKVIAYLRGELPEAEEKDFERLLEEDKELRQTVAVWRDLLAVSDPEAEQARTAFREKARRMMADRRGKASPLKFLWILAAVILLGAVWWLLRPEGASSPTTPSTEVQLDTIVDENSKSTETKDTLGETPAIATETEETEVIPEPSSPPVNYLAMATNAYEAYEVSASKGGKKEETLSRLDRAKSAYSNGYQQDVIDTLTLESDVPLNTEERKLLAHSYFQQGQYEQAAQDFQVLSAGGRYQRSAQWFYLLSELARMPKSRKNFNWALDAILSDPDHPFRAEAQALQKKIAERENQ